MSAHYFNPQEMITKTIIFDERPAASVASSFHVAYGIDKNFLFGCGVSITSVLLHNNDVSFVFHVFIDDIPEADIQRLAQLAKSYRTCIQIHLVNCLSSIRILDLVYLFDNSKDLILVAFHTIRHKKRIYNAEYIFLQKTLRNH